MSDFEIDPAKSGSDQTAFSVRYRGRVFEGKEAALIYRYAQHRKNCDAHHCHAAMCIAHVKPEMLMCFKHWRTVPRKIQQRVWATYRDGQCDDMNPSEEWHEAADAAICAVADKEGMPHKCMTVEEKR